jgi:hypothetical protein
MLPGYLEKYNKVLVTGPQRSGTTFASKIIAEAIGSKYVDEAAYGVSDYFRFKSLVMGGRRLVIQCPSMMRYVHRFGLINEVVIVVMYRPVKDIIGSQQRIKWKYEEHEKRKYHDTHLTIEHINTTPIAKIKYDYWEGMQKGSCKNWCYLNYDSLSWHPKFVQKSERSGWRAKQTERG